MTDRERLREILDKHHLGCCGGDYCDHQYTFEHDKNKDIWDDNMELCIDAILALFPKEAK